MKGVVLHMKSILFVELNKTEYATSKILCVIECSYACQLSFDK